MIIPIVGGETVQYPNGKKTIRQTAAPRLSQPIDFGNRGMTLEEDINETNEYYLAQQKAIIHKKPTPVQIVQVDYPKRSAAVIKEAYFKQASTTDYNGVYRGKYVDFEAKVTKNKTSFPLSNFHKHQINHMEHVCTHGAICFVIMRFSAHDQTFFFEAEKLFPWWKRQYDGGRKSIPYDVICKEGFLIPMKYQAKVDYLHIIDQLHFRTEEEE